MPKITYIDQEGEERTVEAETGASVMETAINNDIPGILATCGGSCSCATCHVYVDDDWLDKLPPPELEESDMLDTAHDLQDNSRLSCQIVVTDELDGLTEEAKAPLLKEIADVRDAADKNGGAAWRRAGVPRVSLGVQSFDPAVLAGMHRTHTVAQVGPAVEVRRALADINAMRACATKH